MGLDMYTVSEDTTVLETMEIIDKNSRGIAFVCDHEQVLRGVVTDGDIRRYILQNGDLKENVINIANKSPYVVSKFDDIDYCAFMQKHSITALPIINKKGEILSIEFLNKKKVYKNNHLRVPVVIMAGGKGTRLYPYTEILPKPLIPIGEKTIIEHIMDRFETFGCNCFNVIVNYKKNFIKSYFLDSEIKRNVEFTDENVFLGTGGGLKLLEGKCEETFFLSNCDILIEEDYSEILETHKREKNIITMVCAMKNVTIPYGTVEVSEKGQVTCLKEKPSYSFLTNTGLYVIEPEFLNKIPENTFIHITDIIQKCLDEGEKVGVYPISDHAWMDMGQIEEMEKMKKRLGV